MEKKYKELLLSATRSKFAYLDKEILFQLWTNNNLYDDITQIIFKDVIETPKCYRDDNNIAQAYSWKQNNILYIIFRGTDNFLDLITDLRIFRTKLLNDNNKVLVHKGFLYYFNLLEKEISNEINNKKSTIDTIHFNGHSLGAGVSTIASCFYKYFYPNIKIINQTFGSPRVGNNQFVKWYNSLDIDNTRVANTKDIISLIPISMFYKHVDNCIYINDKIVAKEKTKDINWFLRLLQLPFHIYYRSPFSRHHCDTYIDRLHVLSNWTIKKFVMITVK